MPTHIQWTDETWNPVTGCSKVSKGCQHCYAERLFPRVYGKDTIDVCRSCRGKGCTDCYGNGSIVPVPRRFTDVVCHPGRLDQPLRWRKPRRVFVNSMSDLFHPDVPDSFIAEVFRVMYMAQRHQFQVLTKRPERMRDFMHSFLSRHEEAREAGYPCAVRHWSPPRNVWLGVSAEDQATADKRVPVLLDIPAAVRFISAEPLLGPVDIDAWISWRAIAAASLGRGRIDMRPDGVTPNCGLDWVIVGGESGQNARPMNLAWARAIVHQCQAASVPVFVKQLGSRPQFEPDDATPIQRKSRAWADPSEWPDDLRVQEWPEVQ